MCGLLGYCKKKCNPGNPGVWVPEEITAVLLGTIRSTAPRILVVPGTLKTLGNLASNSIDTNQNSDKLLCCRLICLSATESVNMLILDSPL